VNAPYDAALLQIACFVRNKFYLPKIEIIPQITQLIIVIPTLPDPMATFLGEMNIPEPA
jgi:hypothetical protein